MLLTFSHQRSHHTRMIDAYLMRARRTSNHQSRHIVSTSPSSTTSCSSSSPSQQSACSPHRLIQLNAETPRRSFLALTFVHSSAPSFYEILTTNFPTIAIRSSLPRPALITPCPPHSLSLSPHEQRAPLVRLSFDPSTHSRSASTTSLSLASSDFSVGPDTSLLFDGHSGISI